MAKAGGVRAGKAYVELGVYDKTLAGLRKAQRRLKAFGASVANIGASLAKAAAVGIGAMVMAARTFAKMGDDIAKMSKRTGVSVQALSELRYVASQTGTSTEALEKSLGRMVRTIYDAGRGLSTAVDVLTDLGLTVKDFQGLSPEQQFKLLADRISLIEDPSRKAAIAMALFGRSGTALLPMMAQGAAGIDQLQKQARKLGLTISEEDAAAAEKFTDDLDSLWKVIKMGVFNIGAALVPLLTKLATTIQDIARRVTDWVKRNQDLIVTIAKTVLWVAAIGAGLIVLGQIIAGVGALIGVVRAAIIVVRGLIVAFTFLAAHPVLLALTALVAVVAAVAIAVSACRKRTAELSDEMQQLMEQGDKQRQLDQGRLQRLGQLADKQRLSNKEVAEARLLMTELTDTYGDLGMSIDAATGKIIGFSRAYAKVNEQVRKAALGQIAARLAETEANIERLKKDTARRAHWETGRIGPPLIDYTQEEEERLKRARLGLAKAEADRQMLIARRNRLQIGLAGAATGGAPPGGVPDLVDPQDWARRVHQLKLQQIEDEHARAKALIAERYKYDLKKAYEAGAAKQTLQKIREAEALEFAALENQKNAEVAAERKQQEEKLATKQKRRQDEEYRRQMAIHRADLTRWETIEQLRLRTTLKGVELEKALLDLDETRALEAAKAAGQRLDLIKAEFALRRKLLDADMSAVAKAAVGGTFAADLRGLLGGGGAAERTARASERIADNTAVMVQQGKNRKGPTFK